jgi:nucleoside-diphosphate-sugar epimerase
MFTCRFALNREGRNTLYERCQMSFESIYVAGHRGLVGSAVLRNLVKNGYGNVLVRTHQQLDLRNREDVQKLGWKPRISLKDGIRRTYEWFLESRRPRSASIAAARNANGAVVPA